MRAHFATSMLVLVTVGTASPTLGQPTLHYVGALPGGVDVSASAVSNGGRVVVGSSWTYDGRRAFTWTRETGIVSLDSQATTISSYALDVTRDGTTIIGTVLSSQGQYVSKWNESGDLSSISVPVPQQYAIGYGVSDDGAVIVGTNTGAGNERAVRWNSAGTMSELPLLPGTSASWAFDVSPDGGTPVGRCSEDYMTFQPCRWNTDGSVVALPLLPGGVSGRANAVSRHGQSVVGTVDTASTYRAVRWSSNGDVQDLGTLPGSLYSYATDISADGSVIVGGSTGGPAGSAATFWTQATGWVDLNTFLRGHGVDLTGWHLYSSLAVSEDGTAITGNGVYNDQIRVFLVTGIPAPGTLAIGGIAIMQLFARKRKPTSHGTLPECGTNFVAKPDARG